MNHLTRGFIKLEDTVAVTNDGWQAFGDGGRGWNRDKAELVPNSRLARTPAIARSDAGPRIDRAR